jgi:hypothetical protein
VGGDEDAPVVRVELDAYDAPILAWVHAAGLVAFVLALALQAIGGGRAALLEGIAIGLEALKGQIALFPGHWTNAVNRALSVCTMVSARAGSSARVIGLEGS